MRGEQVQGTCSLKPAPGVMKVGWAGWITKIEEVCVFPGCMGGRAGGGEQGARQVKHSRQVVTNGVGSRGLE